MFGSTTCAYEDGTPHPCNLHGVWDTVLIARRQLDDRRYVAELERQIGENRWEARTIGSPAEWAMQSHSGAKAALLPSRGSVDAVYYRAHISRVDESLALGGLRLASVLNRSLTARPPTARSRQEVR